MQRVFFVLLVLVGLVTVGCIGSTLSNTAQQTPQNDLLRDIDDLVINVVSARLETVPNGYILYAVGTAKTQGYWQAELIWRGGDTNTTIDTVVRAPIDDLGQHAHFDFRVLKPLTPTDVGSVPSRTLSTALFLSNKQIDNTKTITIVGQNNKIDINL